MDYRTLVRSMQPTVYFQLGGVGALSTQVDRDLMYSGVGLEYSAGTPRRGGGLAALPGPSSAFVAGSEMPFTSGSGSIYNAANFTVVAWLRRGSTGATHSIVQRAGNGTDFFQYRFETTNKLNFIPANAVNCNSTGTITDLRTHMVAVTVTSSTDIRHYIDGTFDSLTVSGTPVPTSGSHALYIGIYPTGVVPFDGWIGHVAYFPRALTPGEIRRLYVVGNGATNSALAA